MRQLYQQLWGLAANTVVICTRNQEVDQKEVPGDILPALGAQDPPPASYQAQHLPLQSSRP